MNCKNCGNALGPNDVACPFCGTATGIQPVQQQMQQPMMNQGNMGDQMGMPQQPMMQQGGMNMQQPPMMGGQPSMGNMPQAPMMGGQMMAPPPKKNSNIGLIIIIVILLIAIGVAGFFLLKDDSKDTSKNDTKVTETNKGTDKEENKEEEKEENKEEDKKEEDKDVVAKNTFDYNGYTFNTIDGYTFSSSNGNMYVVASDTNVTYRMTIKSFPYTTYSSQIDALATSVKNQGLTNVDGYEINYNGTSMIVISSDEIVSFIVSLSDNVSAHLMIKSTGTATNVNQIYENILDIIGAYSKTTVANAGTDKFDVSTFKVEVDSTEKANLDLLKK